MHMNIYEDAYFVMKILPEFMLIYLSINIEVFVHIYISIYITKLFDTFIYSYIYLCECVNLVCTCV